MSIQIADKVLAFDSQLFDPEASQDTYYRPATVIKISNNKCLVDVAFDHPTRISKGHFIAYVRPIKHD